MKWVWNIEKMCKCFLVYFFFSQNWFSKMTLPKKAVVNSSKPTKRDQNCLLLQAYCIQHFFTAFTLQKVNLIFFCQTHFKIQVHVLFATLNGVCYHFGSNWNKFFYNKCHIHSYDYKMWKYVFKGSFAKKH